jgi:hypothetical protein
LLRKAADITQRLSDLARKKVDATKELDRARLTQDRNERTADKNRRLLECLLQHLSERLEEEGWATGGRSARGR